MTVPEPGLRRTSKRFDFSGWTILLMGGVLAAAGGLVYLLGTATADWVEALGAMLASVAAVLTFVGVVLLVIALVSRRASEHKRFA